MIRAVINWQEAVLTGNRVSIAQLASVTVRALKGKRLELSTPKSMAAASALEVIRSRSHGYEKNQSRALLEKCAGADGVGLHVDTFAHASSLQAS